MKTLHISNMTPKIDSIESKSFKVTREHGIQQMKSCAFTACEGICLLLTYMEDIKFAKDNEPLYTVQQISRRVRCRDLSETIN